MHGSGRMHRRACQRHVALMSTLAANAQGYGYAPEEVCSIGAFPALEELHLSDMLEGDAGPGGPARSRFHMPHSLTRLQVRPRGRRTSMHGRSWKPLSLLAYMLLFCMLESAVSRESFLKYHHIQDWPGQPCSVARHHLR